MTYTGRQIARAVLKDLGLYAPHETPAPEDENDVLEAGSDLLDSWRTERLTLGGIVITTYSLVTDQADYTIGDGGDFNQDWPESIVRWSVIPDDDAADPLELPMGRPRTAAEWQALAQKTLSGTYPTQMYFDQAWAAGLGTVSFYPVVDNADVDVKLYQRVPAITSLAAATTYTLRPGFMRALKKNLAIEASSRFETATVTPRLEKQAAESLGQLKRSNLRPHRAAIQPAYARIGRRGRRGVNVYTGR